MYIATATPYRTDAGARARTRSALPLALGASLPRADIVDASLADAATLRALRRAYAQHRSHASFAIAPKRSNARAKTSSTPRSCASTNGATTRSYTYSAPRVRGCHKYVANASCVARERCVSSAHSRTHVCVTFERNAIEVDERTLLSR